MAETDILAPGVRSLSAPAGQAAYRRILIVFGALAAVAIAAQLYLALTAPNEFTQVESIIASQSRVFAAQGTLYYDLKGYPYTVCAYMPVFYLLQAGLSLLGLPLLLAGRLIGITALAAIFWLLWRTIELYTADRFAAATGLVLAGVSQLLLSWGTVAQSDVLAIALSFASFYCYARYRVLGHDTIPLAALLALAGLLTKQTVIAAPAAIFLLLLTQRPAKALQFAAITGGLGAAIVLGLNYAMDGRFLANTLFANLNPFAWYKFQQHLEFAAFLAPTLLLIVVLGARKAIRGGLGAPFLYLLCAALVFLGTCGKIGAGTNYRLESTLALILCACLALHALDFFPLFFRQSKSWVTLLLLPVGIYAVQNLRFDVDNFLREAAYQREFSRQSDAVRPHLAGAKRILSADTNVLIRTGRNLEVEPLIYRLLVEAGRIDPTPLDRDLRAAAFDRIVLYEDVSRTAGTNAEIPRLTPAQNAIIHGAYRLAAHIPGPYLDGLYLYEPRQNSRPPQGTP
ncbi:hypothetical protein [Paludibaculum fermentans]|uniref:hypothetical protein n=1 Tax=Paludibaculum fermentans TaxID=1473598 RepID=UPI003EBFCFB1